MLTLGFQKGGVARIGEDIVIVYLGKRPRGGGYQRIGFIAPSDVRIDRECCLYHATGGLDLRCSPRVAGVAR